MKYSPISDCGRVSQVTSVFSLGAPGTLTSTDTSALLRARRSTFIGPIAPARTPEILKSEPSVRPKALSSWIQYCVLPLSCSVAPPASRAKAPMAARTIVVARIRRMR
jgi:hypothetical protein